MDCDLCIKIGGYCGLCSGEYWSTPRSTMGKLFDEYDRLTRLLQDSSEWDNELLGHVLAQRQHVMTELEELEK